MSDAIEVHGAADVAEGVTLGARTRIWQFTIIMEGAQVGEDCNICSHVLIEGDVVVGDRVTVKNGVQLWNGLRIGDDVFIGPNATFSNDKYPQSRNHTFNCLPTIVGNGVSIGASAVILPGIRLGAGATVGAGAVVTKDVAPSATVVGNPAKEKRASSE